MNNPRQCPGEGRSRKKKSGFFFVLHPSSFILVSSCFVLFFLAWPGGGAPRAQEEAKPLAPPGQLEGALWVGADGASYREPLKLDRLVQELRPTPFGSFVLQVRDGGAAFYTSARVPRTIGIPPGYDPLAEFIKAMKAEARPRRVVAWFSPYRLGGTGIPAADEASDVAKAHPEWLSSNASGETTDADGSRWLEPGLPEVQVYLEAAVAELAAQYAIDELYLDPLSDVGGDGRWGYHPATLQEWARRSGSNQPPDPSDPNWIALRAQVLDRALEGLARSAHTAKPGLIVAVGAETLGPAPEDAAQFQQTPVYRVLRQNWPGWMQTKAIDKVYLKDFKDEASEAEDFSGWMRLALALGGQSGVAVTIGVAGERNESVDALAQLRRAAEAGAAGLALADYARPVRDIGSRTLFLDALGGSLLSPDYRAQQAARAALPRPAVRPVATPSADSRPTSPAVVARTPITAWSTPDTTLTLPPLPLEQGEAVAIDAATQAALNRLRDGEATPPSTRTTTLFRTRREVLQELLADPRFAQSRGGSILRPNEASSDRLRETFPNIF
jgi:uncharacterized lipoprotein YddW (UPF0748 family)